MDLGAWLICSTLYSPQLIKLNTFVCLWPIRNHAQAHLNIYANIYVYACSIYIYMCVVCISSSFCRTWLFPPASAMETSVIFSQFRCVAFAWHENSMEWTRAHGQAKPSQAMPCRAGPDQSRGLARECGKKSANALTTWRRQS